MSGMPEAGWPASREGMAEGEPRSVPRCYGATMAMDTAMGRITLPPIEPLDAVSFPTSNPLTEGANMAYAGPRSTTELSRHFGTANLP